MYALSATEAFCVKYADSFSCLWYENRPNHLICFSSFHYFIIYRRVSHNSVIFYSKVDFFFLATSTLVYFYLDLRTAFAGQKSTCCVVTVMIL